MPPKLPFRLPRKTPSPKLTQQPQQTTKPHTTPPPKSQSRPSYAIPTYTLLTTLATLLFLRDSLLSLDVVNGSSMSPTLSPHAHSRGEKDLVLIYRWKVRSSIKRGDVVTFRKPHRPEEISIKRVIGVAGDVIEPGRGWAVERDNSGRVFSYTDGLPLKFPGDEEWGWGDDREGKGEGREKVVVPVNHIWVEGDNWRSSFDSRDFGPVSKALVDGKAVGVLRGWWWEDVGDKRKGRDDRKGASKVRVGQDEGLPEAFRE